MLLSMCYHLYRYLNIWKRGKSNYIPPAGRDLAYALCQEKTQHLLRFRLCESDYENCFFLSF